MAFPFRTQQEDSGYGAQRSTPMQQRRSTSSATPAAAATGPRAVPRRQAPYNPFNNAGGGSTLGPAQMQQGNMQYGGSAQAPMTADAAAAQAAERFGTLGDQGATQGAPAGEEQKSELEQMYEDLLAKAESGWGNIEALQQANSAALQRRAVAMQGAMGSAIGGGFAGALGQAGIMGQQGLMDARMQHDQAMNALREKYIGAKEGQSRYQTEQDWRSQMYADQQAEREAELQGQERAQWTDDEIINAYMNGELTAEEAQRMLDARQRAGTQDLRSNWAAEGEANMDLDGDGYIGAPPSQEQQDKKKKQQESEAALRAQMGRNSGNPH